jgi:hypothetical protein
VHHYRLAGLSNVLPLDEAQRRTHRTVKLHASTTSRHRANLNSNKKKKKTSQRAVFREYERADPNLVVHRSAGPAATKAKGYKKKAVEAARSRRTNIIVPIPREARKGQHLLPLVAAAVSAATDNAANAVAAAAVPRQRRRQGKATNIHAFFRRKTPNVKPLPETVMPNVMPDDIVVVVDDDEQQPLALSAAAAAAAAAVVKRPSAPAPGVAMFSHPDDMRHDDEFSSSDDGNDDNAELVQLHNESQREQEEKSEQRRNVDFVRRRLPPGQHQHRQPPHAQRPPTSLQFRPAPTPAPITKSTPSKTAVSPLSAWGTRKRPGSTSKKSSLVKSSAVSAASFKSRRKPILSPATAVASSARWHHSGARASSNGVVRRNKTIPAAAVASSSSFAVTAPQSKWKTARSTFSPRKHTHPSNK